MPVPTSPARAESLAQQLLDAQVVHHLERLTGDELTAVVTRLADGVLDAMGRHRLDELLDEDAITAIVTRSLATVPESAAVCGIVDLAEAVAYAGPADPSPLGEVVPRAQVEALLDALLGLTPVLERGLDRLTDSPLATTIASRFMGRVVGEVLQANRAVTDKVPGLGSLMSFGTSAASRVMGAADKQFEGLIGDTFGKGSTFAVRRLNRIVVETLLDPTTREAVLQVWDLAAQDPVTGLEDEETREGMHEVVDAIHDLVVTTLAGPDVAHLAKAVVEAFFERFGAHTPTELLDALGLEREDLVADLVRMSPPVVEALRESGDLERLVRAELEPFYSSKTVLDLLG